MSVQEERSTYGYTVTASAASDAILQSVTDSSRKLDAIHGLLIGIQDLLDDLCSNLAPDRLFHLGKGITRWAKSD